MNKDRNLEKTHRAIIIFPVMIIFRTIKTSLARSYRQLCSKAPEGKENISKQPERSGNSVGESGWRWDNEGAGMGGKQYGLATGMMEEVGMDKNSVYKVPEYFGHSKEGVYFFYDMEKELVDSGKRLEQPDSGLDGLS